MIDEMTALATNKTRQLVPRKPDINVVGSKWVFKTRLMSDGSLN